MLTISQPASSTFASIHTKEWLLTNGLGGYSSSTVSGMNTRRYHGLLVAATTPPVGRTVMLSKLEETLIVDGARIDLSTNAYGEDTIHPEGYRYLQQFSLDPFPISTFAGPHFTLTKSIFMVQGENTVVIEYVLTNAASHDIALELRPLIAFRDYHSTTHENSAINGSFDQTPGCIKLQPYPDLPALFLAHDADIVTPDGNWYRNFEYEIERARGLDHHEDLFCPLVLTTRLNNRTRLTLIASTGQRSTTNATAYREAEIHRHALISPPNANSELISALLTAADQFIVARPPFKTVIAGYPWFGDWGRDTMIALPGLLLSTGHPDAAKEILLEFLKYVDGGMLPNRFPDHDEAPEYNTVDATLWFFEAIYQYLNYSQTPDWQAAALHLIETTFYPVLKTIIDLHISGTRYGIHADADGFLWAGDDTTQLTWMDAKIGDTAFTPRSGRAVEIQALWYNALRIMEEFGHHFKDPAADHHSAIATTLQQNFTHIFWNEEGNYLFDVVNANIADPAVRPNQVIAISLRHCLLDKHRAQQVLEVAERELLTPFGLRTLSSLDPQYRPHYQGDSWHRDSAYHQGTVWPWLAGPFFTAKLRFAGDPAQALADTTAWLSHFTTHLHQAGLNQISEIFDGDAPHHPRGCYAQAWSVAEILRLAKHVATQAK